MTFDRPLLLALLVAVPILWWLHRRRREPVVVRVASVLPFRGGADAVPPASRRRAAAWALALLAIAAGALSLAAAGPSFGATARDAILVVVDDSASMGASLADGTTVLRDALSRAAALLARAAPPAEIHVRTLGSHETRVVANASALADLAFDVRGEDGLPGRLPTEFEAAMAQAFPGAVVVTDAALPAARGLVVIGPATAAARNTWLAGAVLDGDSAVVTVVTNADAPVRALVSDGDRAVEVIVAAHGAASARLRAPRRGARARYTIVANGGSLAADDVLTVERVGHRARALVIEHGRRARELAFALEAADVDTADAGAPSPPYNVRVVHGGTIEAEAGDLPVLHVAPRASAPRAPVTVVPASSRRLRGDQVVGSSDAAVLPAPATTLIAPTRLSGGAPMLRDAEGVLVAAAERLVVIAMDPEDASSTWHDDPSFPVTIAAAIDALTGGGDRLASTLPVPAQESDLPSAAPALPSPEDVASVVRHGAARDAVVAGAGAARPATALYLVAAALVAAAVWLLRPR